MAVKGYLIDGSGTDVHAKVSESENKGVKSQNLHVTIASVEPGFSLPTQLGISGRVFNEYATDGASSIEMNVNGSVTPVEYTVNVDTVDDIIISSIFILGSDNGIKLENFLGRNASITNAMIIEIKSDDVIYTYNAIETTNDMVEWCTEDKFVFLTSQSGDTVKPTLVFSPAIPLRASGTFGAGAADDDYIKVTIGGNLTQVSKLRVKAIGNYAEAGTL